MSTTNRRIPARSFTLVELMVVITVIVILAALTLTVSSSLLRGSEIRETDQVLRLLDTAAMEFEIAAGRRLTYGVMPGSYDYDIDMELEHASVVCSTADEDVLVEALHDVSDVYFAAIGGVTSVRAIITGIDDAYAMFDEASASWHFSDPWGNPILVVLPGRRHEGEGSPDYFTPCIPRDGDGSIATVEEIMLGSAVDGRLYFVSAGPDGRFGNMCHYVDDTGSCMDALEVPDPSDLEYQATLDNIYSYEVDRW